MDKLKTVMMPDGNAFDEHDWRVYSKQFKAKPVTITALKLECEVAIDTLEGVMIGKPGDWLVKGLAGEFYPVKNEIFKQKYEPQP